MDQLTFEQLPTAFVNLYNKVESIEKLLLKEYEPQPDADIFLTIQQAAEFLKLSVPTLYGLVSKATIPVSKRGKRLYFSKQELTTWIKAGRKKAFTEIQWEAQRFINRKAK